MWGGLSASLEQWDKEVAGTCLTEIAAVMNRAPETTPTSSLQKISLGPKPCLSPKEPKLGLVPGKLEEMCWGVGVEVALSIFFQRGRAWPAQG